MYVTNAHAVMLLNLLYPSGSLFIQSFCILIQNEIGYHVFYLNTTTLLNHDFVCISMGCFANFEKKINKVNKYSSKVRASMARIFRWD